MLDWVRAHEQALWGLVALSVVTFAASVVAIPILVARIPSDYFTPRRRRRAIRARSHPLLYVLGLVAKNLLGLSFIAAGIAMLVLPGQGIVTILIGVLLSDFPGKFAMERALVRRPSVLRAINWMRRKADRPPLEVPPRRPRRKATRIMPPKPPPDRCQSG